MLEEYYFKKFNELPTGYIKPNTFCLVKIGDAIQMFLTDKTGMPLPVIAQFLHNYEKVFGNTLTSTIPESEHGVSSLKGVTLLNPQRQEVDAHIELQNDGSVYIESNISLLGYTLIIY
jgi:hypothetical protein